MPSLSTKHGPAKLESTKLLPTHVLLTNLLPTRLLPAVLRNGLLNRLANVTVALAALLLLALLLAALLVLTRAMPPPLTPASATIAAVDLNLTGNGDDAAGGMVARPLFWSERRPYVATAESSEVTAEARGPDAFDKVSLVGIFATGRNAGGAIVDVDGQRQRIMLNDKVHGWQLTGVAADHVTFVPANASDRRGGGTRKLELEHAVVTGKGKGRQQPAPATPRDSLSRDSPSQDSATDNNQATQQDSNE